MRHPVHYPPPPFSRCDQGATAAAGGSAPRAATLADLAGSAVPVAAVLIAPRLGRTIAWAAGLVHAGRPATVATDSVTRTPRAGPALEVGDVAVARWLAAPGASTPLMLPRLPHPRRQTISPPSLMPAAVAAVPSTLTMTLPPRSRHQLPRRPSPLLQGAACRWVRVAS